ncbi:MAG: dihydrofolate reductase [Gammaproteobacteria bacterium]|nr:dihydrofolate reductase [Gammaproteobacteria bacterium]
MMILIAAVDTNRAIGKGGKLLCHLPVDLQYFKKHTRHQSILMGRKTFESIGKVLPERENFILTHQKKLQISGATCVHSLEEAIKKKHNENLWVIGGAEIYAQCLPFAEKILLTEIQHAFSDADTFFPMLDLTQWEIVNEEFHATSEKNIYPLNFVTYQKIKAK